MKRVLRLVPIFLVALGLAGPACAELVDHGPNSEYFLDTETGLYWLDPMLTRSSTRVIPDWFAAYAEDWEWATSAEIDALLGQAAQSGLHLEYILGDRFSTVANGGPRWLGYHSLATSPDGWLAESDNAPYFDEITATGFQGGAAAQSPGAWLHRDSDPLIDDRLWDAGVEWELFYDAGTDYYWQDPDNFAGMSRAEVQAWLDIHPTWRWATQSEVFALQGVRTQGDRPLEEIMGDCQFVPTGGARWIGFYAENTSPDGLLLETRDVVGEVFVLIAGTQGGAASWNAGAWILTEANPVPTEPANWGNVKSMFR